MTEQPSSLREAREPRDILAVVHPHLGKVESGKGLAVLFGILTARSRKIESIESISGGKSETVGLQIDPSRFMVTIGRSFVLITLQHASGRQPILQKSWKRIGHEVGKGIAAEFGTEDRFIDAGGLHWIHRYGRRDDFDELSALDSSGAESLYVVLETIR